MTTTYLWTPPPVPSLPVRELIWNIPELIADLSKVYRLQPGDLIFSGTPRRRESGAGRCAHRVMVRPLCMNHRRPGLSSCSPWSKLAPR
jgi:Fumarylacetoacetate (FAA) hydrolase family